MLASSSFTSEMNSQVLANIHDQLMLYSSCRHKTLLRPVAGRDTYDMS